MFQTIFEYLSNENLKVPIAAHNSIATPIYKKFKKL